MTVEQAIRERLVATPGVAALAGTRVRQLLLRQKETMPAVRVQLISEPRQYQLRGEDGAVRSRVQVDAYDAEDGGAYAGAVALADAVRAALSGQRFTDSGSPPSVQVTGCFVDGRRVMYEAEEQRLVRVSQDFIVWSKTV